MKYRNTVTGAVINVNSEIKGGNWEPVEVPKPTEKSEAPAQKEKPKRNTKK